MNICNRSHSITRFLTQQRDLSTGPVSWHYANTWKDIRRVQNPEIAKNLPTREAVKHASFRKASMLYVCGLATTGSLGIKKYYMPEKGSIEDYRKKDTSASTFRRLSGFASSDVIHDVACGYGFSVIAAKLEGTSHTALGFGLNTHSQIGYQAARPGFPLEIVNSPAPICLPTTDPVIKVSCGRSHTLILDRKKQVFSLGNNSFGQCGRPIIEKESYFGSRTVNQIKDLPNNVEQIECGQDHSMFLTEDGKLFTCGWGADGQTGLGHYNNEPMPQRVKGDLEGTKVIKVSARADTSLALDDSGNVFGWGNSEYAQFSELANCPAEQFGTPRHLNLIDIPGKVVDIAAGGSMCALLNDFGQVFVWGYGILGKGPNVDHSSRPTLLPESLFGRNIYNPEAKVVKIYASLSHFAAIDDKGELYMWGKNRGGSLGFAHGQNQYFPMRVNMNMANVKKVSLGVDHTCALVEKVC